MTRSENRSLTGLPVPFVGIEKLHQYREEFMWHCIERDEMAEKDSGSY
jgi:hypothetical protein